MGFLPRLEIVQVAKQGKPAGVSRDVFSSHTAVPGGAQELERKAAGQLKLGEYLLRDPISKHQHSSKPQGVSDDVSKLNVA